MVKRLEEISEKYKMKSLKDQKPKEHDLGKLASSYGCDCDSFGGGDPPCDCNR